MPKQPRSAPRKRKYIVSVPLTVTACVEVSAESEQDAINEASAIAENLTPLYSGWGYDMDRPSMLEVEGGWFLEPEYGDIFRMPGAKAKRK